MAGIMYVTPKATWSSSQGDTPISGSLVVACDSVVSQDYLVLGGVVKTQKALAVTKSLTQAFHISSSAEVTVYYNGTNAVQTVTISGSPTGGTFTLTFGGYTTAGIAYNATAAVVQTALEALTSFGTGNVTVTGSNGGPYTVTFVGSLGLAAQSTMTASAAGLTGGTPSIAVASTTSGVAPDATWTIKAGSAETWRASSILTNPMPGNLVNVYITNAGTTSALVKLRFAVNAS